MPTKNVSQLLTENIKLRDSMSELFEFLDELRAAARAEIKEIENKNCYGAGYEVGKIDIINEIKAFIKGAEYDFGKDY